MKNDISQILQFLYIGGEDVSVDRETMTRLGINYVINCTCDRPNYFEKSGVKYLQVYVNDDSSNEIDRYFTQSFQFIEEAKRVESSVLVHCQKGMSRSSTVVLAYLMKYENMDLISAFSHTKQRRPLISPNTGFMQQLLLLEHKLYSKNTLDITLYSKDRFAPIEQLSTI